VFTSGRGGQGKRKGDWGKMPEVPCTDEAMWCSKRMPTTGNLYQNQHFARPIAHQRLIISPSSCNETWRVTYKLFFLLIVQWLKKII
jgi:hypothetical protein